MTNRKCFSLFFLTSPRRQGKQRYTTVFLPILSMASTYFSLLWAPIPLPERQTNPHLDGAAVKKRQKPQKKQSENQMLREQAKNVESFRWEEGKKRRLGGVSRDR